MIYVTCQKCYNTVSYCPKICHLFFILGLETQALFWHFPDWTETPGQGLPPYIGAGALQALLLTLVPAPQVRLHLEYALHLPHTPLTIWIEVVYEKVSNNAPTIIMYNDHLYLFQNIYTWSWSCHFCWWQGIRKQNKILIKNYIHVILSSFKILFFNLQY